MNCSIKQRGSEFELAEYDFRSRKYDVFFYLKVGKYYLNQNLCNKKNSPYMLIIEGIKNLSGNIFVLADRGLEFYFVLQEEKLLLKKICIQIRIKLNNYRKKNDENLFSSLSQTAKGIWYLEKSNLLKDLVDKVIQPDYPID